MWQDLVLGSHRTQKTPNPSLCNYRVYFFISAVSIFSNRFVAAGVGIKMLRGAECEAVGMSGDPRQRPLLLLGWAPRQRGEGAVTILAPPGGPRHCRFLRKEAMCLVRWPVKRKFCKKKKRKRSLKNRIFFFMNYSGWYNPSEWSPPGTLTWWRRVVGAATSQTWACVR